LASSLIVNSVTRLASSQPAPISAGEWLVWPTSLFCYTLCWYTARPGLRRWSDALAPLLVAAIGLLATAGIIMGSAPPTRFGLPILALPLAWAGKRRQELAWLVYAWMLFAGYKLLVIDLTTVTHAAFSVSLLLYGATLLLLPRLMRIS